MTRNAPKPDRGIGRGKPPAYTRFKPGQSGNLRGRPKGSKNMATLLEAELNQRVTITENGRRVTVTKRELVMKQAVNKAAAGDARMLILLGKQSGAHPAASASDVADTVLDGEDDEQTLLSWMRHSAKDGS